MKNMNELVRTRRSVRAYDGRPLEDGDLEKLSAFMESVENPYGIPVQFTLLDAKKHGLSSPVVSGTNLYVGAKVRREAHAEEAYGYAFEALVLYAWSLGVGTVWIGGTMNRSAFEKAMALEADEMMPCVSPLGYPAAKMSIRETLMRKGARADSRLGFETLFFDRSFASPLSQTEAGRLAGPLEAVRWAPSAVNKQPWRVVTDGDEVHFYLKHDKGLVSPATGDLQKIDVGIAMCHFALTAQEAGMQTVLTSLADPGIPAPDGVEYIATFVLS